MLPIILPALNPEYWRSLEKQLIAIAAKERSQLERRDRIVNNSIPLAQSYARQKQWGDLFRFLVERNIVAIPSPSITEAPPKKPSQKPKPTKPPRQRKAKEKPCRAPNTPRIHRRSLKYRLQELLPTVLYSDRSISLITIKARCSKHRLEVDDGCMQAYLLEFANKGLCYQYAASRRFVLYSLQPTDEIEASEWLPASLALKFARERGYTGTQTRFAERANVCKHKDLVIEFYGQYGIEYKFDHKRMDILKWRRIN